MLTRLQNINRLVICLPACLMLAGCDVIYRFLDKEGAEEKALIGEVIPFEKNLVIEEVQALLYLYGYNAGKIDGVLGLRTRNAIARFQEDNGLEPTRLVDQATWEKLAVFKNNGLIVEQQLNVRLVQELLKGAGFNPGPIDGNMGKRTRTAIEKFQKARGLKADGKVGYQTMSKLAEYISTEPQPEQ